MAIHVAILCAGNPMWLYSYVVGTLSVVGQLSHAHHSTCITTLRCLLHEKYKLKVRHASLTFNSYLMCDTQKPCWLMTHSIASYLVCSKNIKGNNQIAKSYFTVPV